MWLFCRCVFQNSKIKLFGELRRAFLPNSTKLILICTSFSTFSYHCAEGKYRQIRSMWLISEGALKRNTLLLRVPGYWISLPGFKFQLHFPFLRARANYSLFKTTASCSVIGGQQQHFPYEFSGGISKQIHLKRFVPNLAHWKCSILFIKHINCNQTWERILLTTRKARNSFISNPVILSQIPQRLNSCSIHYTLLQKKKKKRSFISFQFPLELHSRIN